MKKITFVDGNDGLATLRCGEMYVGQVGIAQAPKIVRAFNNYDGCIEILERVLHIDNGHMLEEQRRLLSVLLEEMEIEPTKKRDFKDGIS